MNGMFLGGLNEKDWLLTGKVSISEHAEGVLSRIRLVEFARFVSKFSLLIMLHSSVDSEVRKKEGPHHRGGLKH